jgi:hypothetical protein
VECEAIEYIANSAVNVEGRIYQGARHWLAMQVALHAGESSPIGSGDAQGFITTWGRYVTREEAGRIAFVSKQTYVLKGILYSEDLWGPPSPPT